MSRRPDEVQDAGQHATFATPRSAGPRRGADRAGERPSGHYDGEAERAVDEEQERVAASGEERPREHEVTATGERA